MESKQQAANSEDLGAWEALNDLSMLASQGAAIVDILLSVEVLSRMDTESLQLVAYDLQQKFLRIRDEVEQLSTT